MARAVVLANFLRVVADEGRLADMLLLQSHLLGANHLALIDRGQISELCVNVILEWQFPFVAIECEATPAGFLSIIT